MNNVAFVPKTIGELVPQPEAPLIMHCGYCNREWFVCWTPIAITDFVALAKAQKCGCEAEIAAEGEEEIADGRKIMMNRAIRPTSVGDWRSWPHHGDTGESSEAIWCQMVGRLIDEPWGRIRRDPRGAYPHDASDFGRCHRLLEVMPEWRARLPEMGEAWPAWEPLVAHWDRLTALFVAENFDAVDATLKTLFGEVPTIEEQARLLALRLALDQKPKLQDTP